MAFASARIGITTMNIIRKIHNLLLKNKETIAVAESCTGGALSASLTGLSRSSEYFMLGAVAYNNRSKESILKIPHSLIAKEGAVSARVAQLLAENIRKIAKTDFGLGITGIAGPTGATAGKPIGLVFIAVASKNKTSVHKFKFRGNRPDVRKQAVKQALRLLERYLL